VKVNLPKWVRVCGCILLAGTILTTACVGCGALEQRKTEARIRNYFALGPSEPLTSPVIQSNLLAYFPLGTPVDRLETWLMARGLGVDGHSVTWQTNQYVSYHVYDYSDAFFSMRHIQVTAGFDGQLQITNIQAEVYSYGL